MGKIYGTGIQEEDKDFQYTEQFMQSKLSNFFAYNTVKYDIDGLYIFEWESDKFIETRSGLIYEFEIKVSKSDFKNDFKNKKDKHIILEGEDKYGDKYLPKYYERLEKNREIGAWAEKSFKKYADTSPRYMVSGHKRPNYFYYCTPPGVVDVEEVPSYAGLVYVDKSGLITIKKKAPKLHGDKIKDEDLGLGEKFYFNMDSWRTKCKNAWKDTEFWRKKFNNEIESKGQSKAYKDLEQELEWYKESQLDLIEKNAKEKAQLHRDLAFQCRLSRELVNEILKYKPDFDYCKFVDGIEDDSKLKL
jgi:hypothetical protein